MNDSLDLAFAALADPTRRAILARLGEGEASVAELAEPFDLSQPAISKHLKVLENAGFIETSRVGQSRPRRLRPAGLEAPQRCIEQLASYWPDRFDRLAQFLAQAKENGQ
ncbi:metalloregulator ArsR/SmtB family transcription factor [Altererythrobacter arenosus]|uniref:Metalloregulator ArsR/SmtB family transcription factor n=1 Tax=Altererythrobacter arenosus TaxID=3032592 RepID=A0ABY8FPK2_9SPHN|nr:metalloregulator ArsR/SmtB family transcription factor [Altererythrobacter sp. CAU 1644]WFL76787.1 metalloregulator ArsR/SmtB family transcription factor [Altererythrobacter sp. CAU 1644]